MKTHVLFAAGLLSLATGCAELHVVYTPTSAPRTPPTGQSVRVRVDNARPSDQGGSSRIVGVMRRSLGTTFDLEDSDPQVVIRSVADATKDALGKAGIGISERGQFLTAAVRELWVDAYGGYRCAVTVEYTLWSAAGKPLWVASLRGTSWGYDIMRSWPSMTEEMVQRALMDVVAQATVAFRSPGFVAAASLSGNMLTRDQGQ